MGLKGTFTPKNEKTVYVWELPDKNGDGPTVQVQDENGTWIDKEDPNGNPVKHYSPPEGFENKPSRDEHGQITADNYVLVDKGQIVRDSTGIPLSIVEGGAAVIESDGTYSSIPPNQLKNFLANHTQV